MIVLLLIMMLSLTSGAQTGERRFGFELSSGLSVATNKLSDAKLKPGMGFEGVFHYSFIPCIGIYAGWGWNRFSSESSFAGENADFEETGYVAGLQFKQNSDDSPVSLYLRGGMLYNHIEIENREGDIINDSKHGYGWQVAGGVDIKLSEKWSLTPGVKFNSLSRNIYFENVARELNHNYLSFRIGILKRF